MLGVDEMSIIPGEQYDPATNSIIGVSEELEQENLDIKIAPKLNKDIITVTRFNKTRVNKATNMFSNDISCALNLLREEKNRTEYSTTASFIDIVSKWYNLLTSRHAVFALGKNCADERSHEKI